MCARSAPLQERLRFACVAVFTLAVKKIINCFALMIIFFWFVNVDVESLTDGAPCPGPVACHGYVICCEFEHEGSHEKNKKKQNRGS